MNDPLQPLRILPLSPTPQAQAEKNMRETEEYERLIAEGGSDPTGKQEWADLAKKLGRK